MIENQAKQNQEHFYQLLEKLQQLENKIDQLITNQIDSKNVAKIKSRSPSKKEENIFQYKKRTEYLHLYQSNKAHLKHGNEQSYFVIQDNKLIDQSNDKNELVQKHNLQLKNIRVPKKKQQTQVTDLNIQSEEEKQLDPLLNPVI